MVIAISENDRLYLMHTREDFKKIEHLFNIIFYIFL